MPRREAQYLSLFKCVIISLSLIAAVEYFKYATQANYEWFHCTPSVEPIGYHGSSLVKLSSKGGPSCDKRGEFKTIVKKITRDFDVNKQHISFCIIENANVPPIHYPIHEDKGQPGYVAYAGYNNETELIEEHCGDATIFNI
ncbi:hypothetical protein HG535_0E00480 [Zygotorulaspora mrakii]|uniref:Ceramide synthase subunit LIP1 n=1 Tax=Zygotorulaspora mrakii TaxID=42260 RepID=A0A7H9B3I7_ZYGMR|nr:uncharacterized protein HG535_0E00480 [Zygotorulaspora mrakii]QLG72964.1 hypothetical protein HG535_0E00480 [Zygotorulaspora mrakii]